MLSTNCGLWRRTVLTAWNTSTSECWITCLNVKQKKVKQTQWKRQGLKLLITIDRELCNLLTRYMHWQHNKRPHESVRRVRQYTPVPSPFVAIVPPYSSIRLMNLWMSEPCDPWASMSIERVEPYGDCVCRRARMRTEKNRYDAMNSLSFSRSLHYEPLKTVSILTLPSHRPLTPSARWLFCLCEISMF